MSTKSDFAVRAEVPSYRDTLLSQRGSGATRHGDKVGRGSIWVDPATYLPVQETVKDPTSGRVVGTTVFQWTPRSAAGAPTTAAVPPGYKHVPSQGLPQIFGD